MSEIMRRADIIRRKREARRLMFSVAVLGAVALAEIILVSTVRIPADAGIYPLKFNPILGGYVLIGIPAFASGIVLTLAVQKIRTLQEFLSIK